MGKSGLFSRSARSRAAVSLAARRPAPRTCALLARASFALVFLRAARARCSSVSSRRRLGGQLVNSVRRMCNSGGGATGTFSVMPGGSANRGVKVFSRSGCRSRVVGHRLGSGSSTIGTTIATTNSNAAARSAASRTYAHDIGRLSRAAADQRDRRDVRIRVVSERCLCCARSHRYSVRTGATAIEFRAKCQLGSFRNLLPMRALLQPQNERTERQNSIIGLRAFARCASAVQSLSARSPRRLAWPP